MTKRPKTAANAVTPPADFSDPESQRVLAAAARAVAVQLGRQAAREYFAEQLAAHRRIAHRPGVNRQRRMADS
jgi:hypothetical protein